MSRGRERRRHVAQQRRQLLETRSALQNGGFLVKLKHRMRVNTRLLIVREIVYVLIFSALWTAFIVGIEYHHLSLLTIFIFWLDIITIVGFVLFYLLRKRYGEDYQSGYVRPLEREVVRMTSPTTWLTWLMDRIFFGKCPTE